MVIPKELIKKAGANGTDANHQEDNSSVLDDEDGDESPRNFIKVFEVECYYEDGTNASPTTK